MMTSIKNFKGVRHNMDEFDGSDNEYLNAQYKLFRKRLVELYHNMGRILGYKRNHGRGKEENKGLILITSGYILKNRFSYF